MANVPKLNGGPFRTEQPPISGVKSRQPNEIPIQTVAPIHRVNNRRIKLNYLKNLTKLPALGFAFLQLLDEIFLGDDAAVKFQSLGDQRRVLRFQLFLCLKKKEFKF